MISRDIDLVGNTESLETGKFKLIRFGSHKSDRIDTDLMVVIGLLVSDGTHLEDALSGSLILEDLSEEKTQSRIYDNKIVDGVRKEGSVESASV